MRIEKLAELHKAVVHTEPERYVAQYAHCADAMIGDRDELSQSEHRFLERLPLRLEEKWINTYSNYALKDVCSDCFPSPTPTVGA